MKNKGGKREGAGRKPVSIDWSQVDALLSIACTGEEISSVIGRDYDTINKHCRIDKGVDFSEYIKIGINKTIRPSLRRVQRKMALGIENPDGTYIEKPNVSMLIWLGKQYLGQTDKADMTTAGEKLTGTIVQTINGESAKEITAMLKKIEERESK